MVVANEVRCRCMADETVIKRVESVYEIVA